MTIYPDIPGSGCDLEMMVDDAVAQNTPNVLVNPDHWDESHTLLVATCVHGRLDLADRLFSAGATMSARGFEEVLDWKMSAGIATYLLGHKVPFNKPCLSRCIWGDNWDAFFVLFGNGDGVRKGLPASEVTELLSSALSSASYNGIAFAVRRLLQLGSHADQKFDDISSAVLMSVCDWQDEKHKADAETAYWLLIYGTDPNVKTAWGETPLLLCTGQKLPISVHHRRTQTAQMLLRFGANPNAAVPRFETTALMFAARDDDAILARALLKAGADRNMKTPDGRTARDIAQQRGSETVLALLS